MKLMKIALILTILVAILPCIVISEAVSVHLIPHSHCDVGWKKTVQGYFDIEVSRIITNVVDELTNDPEKRFIWVEITYLQMWWNEATEEYQNKFFELLNSKQLEIILGGMVMHDESIVYLSDAIDQMTEGHMWILNTFGSNFLPHIAWHIDPFGSSSLSPTIFGLSSFDYFIINRIDYREKQQMMDTKTLEFHWQGISSPYQRDLATVFTHVLDHHYSAPPHCDWESDRPWDNPPITDENINSSAIMLAAEMKMRASMFRTNTILVPFGDDFRFQNATAQFDNMWKLITYINDNTDVFGVDLKYSTLSEFIEAEKAEKETYPIRKQKDFFVYIDHPHHCWSGYYTSWPYLKEYARTRSALLRAVDSLYGLSILMGHFWEGSNPLHSIMDLRRAVSILQHHDAITGTSPLDTRTDYMQMLSNGTEKSIPWIETLVGKFLEKNNNGGHGFKFGYSWIYEPLNKGKTLALVLYNSIEQEREEWIEIPGVPCNIEVKDTSHDLFYCDSMDDCDSTQCMVAFKAVVPPLGVSTFFVSPSTAVPVPKVACTVREGTITLNSSDTSLYFDSYGLIKKIEKKGAESVTLNQEIVSYSPAMFENAGDNVYVFNATGPGSTVQPLLNQTTYCEIGSSGYSRLTSQITPYLRQRVGISNVIVLDWKVGPCPLNSEVAVRFNTDIENKNNTIYTDEYGSFMVKRSLPNEYKTTMECSFYPVTSMTYIEDSTRRLTLFSQFSHAVSSLQEGLVETMIVRNSLEGVWNNDTTVTTQRLWIGFADSSTAEATRFTDMLRHNNPFVTVGHEIETSVPDYRSKYRTTWQALKKGFPTSVHIISLKAQSETNYNVILRFLGMGSDDISISLDEYFNSDFVPTSINETILTSTMPTGEVTGPISLHSGDIRSFVLEKSIRMSDLENSRRIGSNAVTIAISILAGIAGLAVLAQLYRKRETIRNYFERRGSKNFTKLQDE